MSDSAISVNRQRTLARITGCAQQLAEERGLDGFTMEDVAACAGVSRRTLFNYVPGKLDAVLGFSPAPDPSHLAQFRAGGPTGSLAEDLKATIAGFLDDKRTTAQEWDRVRRLIAADARLHKTMHDKFAQVAQFLAEAIRDREGESWDQLRANAAAKVTLSLFDVALDAVLADPARSLAEYYTAAFDGAAALFN